jgi:hypothetical protein
MRANGDSRGAVASWFQEQAAVQLALSYQATSMAEKHAIPPSDMK